MIFGPLKNSTDKRRTGNKRALPLSYFGIWSRRPDSNRRPRAYQAITQSCDPSKTEKAETDKRREWNINRSPGCARFEPACSLKTAFADNPHPTARLNWHSRWESNPYLPKINPGILSQLNYGVIRWASGAADMGLRKRDSNPRHRTFVRRLSHGEQPPLRFGAITCELRPI